MIDMTYNEYLIKLLDNTSDSLTYNDNLKLDIYLTLLSLNNHNYSDKLYQNEISIIEDFLRKVNNLKVKIQLKRKTEEIDSLLSDIKNIYQNNKVIINKYNPDNDEIITIIVSKEPNLITNLIDKLTKNKILTIENKPYYDNLRNQVLDNIFITNHYLENNIVHIGNDITINDYEFYKVFEYLLDINNYEANYLNEEINNLNREITINLIAYLTKFEPLNNYLPVVLTYIFTNDYYSESIDMSKFNIDNIKITELYSFANSKSITNNNAKWKNVIIPNDYLYQKIKLMVNNGKYYFKNNIFIMEIINDFKISIITEDLINFLKANLNNK